MPALAASVSPQKRQSVPATSSPRSGKSCLWRQTSCSPSLGSTTHSRRAPQEASPPPTALLLQALRLLSNFDGSTMVRALDPYAPETPSRTRATTRIVTII